MSNFFSAESLLLKWNIPSLTLNCLLSKCPSTYLVRVVDKLWAAVIQVHAVSIRKNFTSLNQF